MGPNYSIPEDWDKIIFGNILLQFQKIGVK